MQRGAVVFPEVRACLRVRRGKAGGNRYFFLCIGVRTLLEEHARTARREDVRICLERSCAGVRMPARRENFMLSGILAGVSTEGNLVFRLFDVSPQVYIFCIASAVKIFPRTFCKRTPRFARSFAAGLFAEVYGIFGKTPDVGEVSVEAHVVESVADEVFFVDVEAVEVGIDVDSAVVEFVDEHGGFNAFGGELRFEHVEQVVCGVAGIDDIVDQQDVLVVYVGKIADDFDVAFCVEFVAVARNFDKFKLDGRFEASYQVGAKEHAAFEHANNVERFVGGEKVFDFRRDFAGFFANLFLRIQNSQIRVLTVGYVKKFFFVQSSYSVIISSAWVAFWSETRSFSLIPTPAAHKTSLPEHKSKIPSRW